MGKNKQKLKAIKGGHQRQVMRKGFGINELAKVTFLQTPEGLEKVRQVALWETSSRN